MERVTVEIFADVSSPWCYIAKRRLETALRLCREEVATSVRWLPLARFPQVPPDGLDRRAVTIARFGSAARADAADALVTEAARCEGLTLHLDRVGRIPNVFDAHRFVALAEREGVQDAVLEGLFHAHLVEGRDIGMRPALLDAVSAALGRERAAQWLDSSEGLADVWAEQGRAQGLNVRGVPFVFIGGAAGPSWPWDPWALAAAIRAVAGRFRPETGAGPAAEELRYGLHRTRCGCDFCRVYCRHIPGRLAVGDVARLCPEGADVFAWAEEHLQAVTDAPYPKLVPVRGAGGQCHWYVDGGCTVHDRAPYGCAYFDAHMSSDEVKRRGLPANLGSLDDAAAGGLDFRVWRHLVDRGLVRLSGRREPVDEEMRLLRQSIEFG